MWYDKNNLRLAQEQRDINQLAIQNYGKPNQPFQWLEPVEDGSLLIILSNDAINKLRKIYKNLGKPLKIAYTFYYDDYESGHVITELEFKDIPEDIDTEILQEIKQYVKEKAKIIFPSNSEGKLISPFKIEVPLDLKAFIPEQAKENIGAPVERPNIDFSKFVRPVRQPKLQLPEFQPAAPVKNREIKIQDNGSQSISPPQFEGPKPKINNLNIISDELPDINGDVQPKPIPVNKTTVKYPKYNFPINVESLSKSSYKFKAPVEIYIDGNLITKGHPNQSFYPLYSEYLPLSEGSHTLEARDPNFNTTNTKITNKQIFTFEVKENQPIKITKIDPRPGSF